MQFVSDKWYDWYSRAMLALSGALFSASLLSLLLPQVKTLTGGLGLSFLTLGLASLHLAYGLLLHPTVRQRSGAYAATLTSNFIFMVNVVNLLQSTGQLHSWYEVLWAFIVFFVGIFGPLTIMAFCFLTLLYLIVIITDVPGQIIIEPFNLAITGLIFATGATSYFFWHGKYEDQESKKIALLSGQLKSNRQQSEILLNAIADGIILIGTDGKINLINPAAAAMTEWTVGEASGISAATVINLMSENGKDLPAGNNPISQVLSKHTPNQQVLQLVGRNHKTITVSIVVSPVIMPKTQQFAGAVAVIRDISNSRAEERRRADFISTASHEMRTPVAAIEGYLALALNDRVSQIDVKARSYLEKAHSSTEHLGKLFQDLLTSAKAEDGRLVSNPIVVEMGSFLEQLAEGLHFAAQKKGLLVDFTIGSESSEPTAGSARVIKPLYYSEVDPERIREVITNLYDNAVKYTESGRITIGLTGDDKIIQLSIKDTGPGIAKEDIPHLFQKFYRVDSSATRVIGGTGLGLFISRKIIEMYKGRIWVASELGKGSTFFINLPRLSSQMAEKLQKAEAVGASKLPVFTPVTVSGSASQPNTPVVSPTP